MKPWHVSYSCTAAANTTNNTTTTDTNTNTIACTLSTLLLHFLLQTIASKKPQDLHEANKTWFNSSVVVP